MEHFITILIYIHAFFGGLGLLTGLASIIVKKGSFLHKKAGKLFSIGMFTSSLISIPISWMPNHKNLFLFLIALFTIYLVLAGNRALTFKPKLKQKAGMGDKLLSGIMLLFSVIMVLIGVYGLFETILNSILYLFFGGFGLLMTIKDFIFFKTFTNIKNAWLLNHISKMAGAFIASVTAFVVAGLGIGSIVAWLLPSILGTVYIIYWRKKFKVVN